MNIAIVTGASSGLGREMVYLLADRFGGLEEIWVIARRKERLDAFEGKLPAKIRKLALDLTNKEDLLVLENELKEKMPKVKVLVNAAGLGFYGAVGSFSREKSASMIRLNVEALTSVTELVLPYLTVNSRIIQFASAAAFLPQPKFAVYAATKSYVLSYSRALAEELRPRNIPVTAVCPGPVATEFFDKALENTTLSPYKLFSMANSKAVAKKALRDSMMGKTVSVPGLIMKLAFILCKILPHDPLIKIMARQ